MTHFEIKELSSIVGGTDKLLELCVRFPNRRLPGKRQAHKILRERFRDEFHGENIKGFAEKYGVCMSTLYNWLNKEPAAQGQR